MVVAGRHPAAVFQPIEEAFDPVACGIEELIDRVLDKSVPPGGDFWLAATRELRREWRRCHSFDLPASRRDRRHDPP
jgi:hypothetical protein